MIFQRGDLRHAKSRMVIIFAEPAQKMNKMQRNIYIFAIFQYWVYMIGSIKKLKHQLPWANSTKTRQTFMTWKKSTNLLKNFDNEISSTLHYLQRKYKASLILRCMVYKYYLTCCLDKSVSISSPSISTLIKYWLVSLSMIL